MRVRPWYRPTREERGIYVPDAPVVVPAPRAPRPTNARYVPHQIVTPAAGNGRVRFDIPHPVVLDDGAPVSVYVRGVAVPVDGYAIAADVDGQGASLTLAVAPSTGDLVTVSGFCRESDP